MSEADSPTPFLSVRREGSTGWLVLDRPERRNALTAAMWRAIPDLIGALDRDAAIRVICVRGAGTEAFAAGADIAEFAGNRSDARTAQAYEAANAAAFAALRGAAEPVIAMIHGYCIGGGLALALACDLRLASESAVFALPPARLGLAYPIDGLRDLLAAVPPALAKEMIFTARRYAAPEALAMGLVNRIFPAAELEAATAALSQEIAANAPLTLTASKRALDAIAGRSGGVDEAELARLAARCFDSADYAEGRHAFIEKRAPIFRGV